MTDWTSRNLANAANALANENANIADRNADIANENGRIARKRLKLLEALRHEHALWQAYVHENAKGNRLASEGNTVAGYTNNLAQELCILKFDLMHEFWAHSHPNTKLALPYSGLPERYETYKQMSMEHRKYINLRMMCRAEWYDWCMHIEVLAKASQAVVKAMMNPTPENASLRNRAYLVDLNREIDAYHDLRNRAMDVTQGVKLRDLFEQERMGFWKDRIRYYIDTEDRNCPRPRTNEIREANPGIRFDLHLPAGRLTKNWGIDITTGKPARCFRDSAVGVLDASDSISNVAGLYL